ncbi:MAG: DUF6147 family protein [Dehalobacterium sp.]|jgi:hypothetical protein
MFKRMLLLSLTVSCLLLFTVSSAFAVQPLTTPPPQETQGIIEIESFRLLGGLECSIDQVGTAAKVFVTGNTTTQFDVDSLTVKIYLQRWTGSSWTDVAYKTYNASNDDYVSGSYSYTVPRGYYYRTQVYHFAKKGSIAESDYSYTSSIFIE